MTDKFLISDPDEQKKLITQARFAELELLHQFGNKMALYDAVALSNELGVGLPLWAVTAVQGDIWRKWRGRLTRWKGEQVPAPKTPSRENLESELLQKHLLDLRKDGYIALLKSYLRSLVYCQAMLWVNDLTKYQLQPTRTIELWFEGKIKQPKSAADALDLTKEGLVGTIAHGSVETIKGFISSDHLAIVNKLKIGDAEIAKDHQMSEGEHGDYLAAQLRDHLKIPFEFGYNETEVIFGLRQTGQFWGPKRKPSKKIQTLLDQQNKDNGASSSEDL